MPKKSAEPEIVGIQVIKKAGVNVVYELGGRLPKDIREFADMAAVRGKSVAGDVRHDDREGPPDL